MYPTPRSHRPLIMGRNGAVGANHPLAAQAGLDMLRAGGNAVDAATAISLALGVVEPMMSGLGGDGFYNLLIDGRRVVYNGTGPAPIAASPDRYPGGIAVDGPRSISVPGCLAGISAMHAAHGRLPWAQLAGPAIEHARNGFAATHGYRHFAADNRARLAADPRSGKAFLDHGLAGLVVQEDLARTLEEIAADGAEVFYRGSLAQRLARGLADAGALVAAADLDACEAEITVPIGITYRGWEITQTPPNSTGFTMLQTLKIAERFDLAAMSAAERIHLLVEAKKRAFLDRETYGSDPRFAAVPLDMLLSDAHADAHAARIDMRRAADLSLAFGEAAADTTYFCVVDSTGNAVSGIQSINSAFGSGVTAGDTGVLMNNRMAYWHLSPGHPNRLAPGKRVRHTMNAPMLFRDGKLLGVLGTPGADNQVQVNAQVITAMLDTGADPQTALELPRWTSSQPGQGANWPHDGDGALTIEEDVGEAVLSDLASRGHRLKRVGHLEGPCAMQAIRVMENGVRAAGSDPRGMAGPAPTDMPRIGVLTFVHETVSFLPSDTTIDDFTYPGSPAEGEALLASDPAGCIGGFVKLAREYRAELVGIPSPLWSKRGTGSGWITNEAFETFVARMIEAISALGPFDGMFMALHGAMAVRGVPRPEAELALRVRRAVGAGVPIAATFDPHGNEDEEFLRHADLAFCVKYFPHYDSYLQGERAARALIRTVGGDYRPAHVTVKVPIISPTVLQWTGASPWMDLVQRALTWEARAPDLFVNLFFGFPWSDVPDVGMTIQVLTNADPALAARVADDMAGFAWRRRQALLTSTKVHAIADGVALAEAAIAEGRTPVVLADHSDRSGAATWLLREIIEQDLPDTLIATVADADALAAALAGPVAPGDGFDMMVGGRLDPSAGSAVRVTGTVLKVITGIRHLPGQTWLVVRFGRGNVLVISPYLVQVMEVDLLAELGLEPSGFKAIALKSRVHFRRGFDDNGFAATILLVEPEGKLLGTTGLDALPYENVKLADYYPYQDQPAP